MKRSLYATLALGVCSLLFAGSMLSGCLGGTATAPNTEQQANRAYMSQVNEIMDELSEGLDAFVEAVSTGDAVNMRNRADNAYRALDELSSLEAPDALAGIQESYVNGTAKLREALDEYIALYASIEGGSFDKAAYESALEKAQSLYNEGYEILKQGDEDAAQL